MDGWIPLGMRNMQDTAGVGLAASAVVEMEYDGLLCQTKVKNAEKIPRNVPHAGPDTAPPCSIAGPTARPHYRLSRASPSPGLCIVPPECSMRGERGCTAAGTYRLWRPPVHCASHSLPRLPSARFPCGTVPRPSECTSGVVPGLCKRECYHMAQVRGRCYCYSRPAAGADALVHGPCRWTVNTRWRARGVASTLGSRLPGPSFAAKSSIEAKKQLCVSASEIPVRLPGNVALAWRPRRTSRAGPTEFQKTT
ncbi:hypothetical protein K466DRAFT_329026 [Polyporus arcularius HHB13444]|uniref:Uncharacterized protein n=1 Tax=Polyporus arcularius HHB13444 TaxID=1314778 RepID=A0A5C3NW78_9APHY|nr:hypothetical protein K466DRAFT_329026 [Polyporus arcularius HHB13444]